MEISFVIRNVVKAQVDNIWARISPLMGLIGSTAREQAF